jgi:hypothetical protein
MAMRDVIRDAIKAGGATKKSLLELTGTTEKGLASQFTYLRMVGTPPMKQEDGTFKIVTPEEWESHRASGGSAATPLTPAKRLEKAEKRSKRAATAYDNAKKKFEADEDNRMNELKFIKAEAELEIAEIELGKAETLAAAAPTEEDKEVPEVEAFAPDTPMEDNEYEDTADDLV